MSFNRKYLTLNIFLLKKNFWTSLNSLLKNATCPPQNYITDSWLVACTLWAQINWVEVYIKGRKKQKWGWGREQWDVGVNVHFPARNRRAGWCSFCLARNGWELQTGLCGHVHCSILVSLLCTPNKLCLSLSQWMASGHPGASGPPVAQSAPTGAGESAQPQLPRMGGRTARGWCCSPRTARMGSACRVSALSRMWVYLENSEITADQHQWPKLTEPFVGEMS